MTHQKSLEQIRTGFLVSTGIFLLRATLANRFSNTPFEEQLLMTLLEQRFNFVKCGLGGHAIHSCPFVTEGLGDFSQ